MKMNKTEWDSEYKLLMWNNNAECANDNGGEGNRPALKVHAVTLET